MCGIVEKFKLVVVINNKIMTQAVWDSKLLGGSVKNKIVNPDLEEERKKCTFDQKEMEKFVLTEPIWKVKTQIDELCEKYPELYHTMDFYDMTREEKFELWWKKFHKVMQINKEYFTDNSKKKEFYNWGFIFL
jgi:hypothetical protein